MHVSRGEDKAAAQGWGLLKESICSKICSKRAPHAQCAGVFRQDWRRTMVPRNVAKKRSYGTEQQQWAANSVVWGETSLLQPRANCVWFLYGLQGSL